MPIESPTLYSKPDTIENPQTSEEIKNKALEALKQKLVIVDATHLAEMEARDAADAAMTEAKGKAGFWKKLWKHTYMDGYYRQKALDKARDEIFKSDNIYSAVEKDKQSHDRAMEAITERFASEYEEAVNKKVGEEKKTLEETDPKTAQTKADIKKLISDYAKGDINEDSFNSEKVKIFNTIGDSFVTGSNIYASNLFEMAKNAKLAVEHGAKLEELDLDFNVIVGKAKSSIKTEAKSNWIDKTVTGIKKTKIGRFINPATLSTAVALAYTVAAGTGKMFMKSKVSHMVTFGGTAVASGVLAAANESQRLAEERRQHGREMAKGGVIEADSPRRESMEKYAYQTESAEVLMKALRESLFTKDEDGNDVAKQISQSELESVLGHIGNIEARESLASQKKIDLIRYSNPANVEKEHTEMVILLARAKVELAKQVNATLKDGLPDGETFESYLAKQVDTTEKAFLGGEKGITKQDKAFSNLKLRRAALKMGKTVLMGVTIGAAVQESIALADGLWGGHKEGVFEGIYHRITGEGTSNHVQTPLDHLLSGNQHISMENAQDQILTSKSFDIPSHFKLPEGTTMIDNGDGTFNIMRGDDVISDHIELHTDANGALDQASINRLGEDGIIANNETSLIEGAGDTTMNPNEYIDSHPDQTTHIARDGWYDNDTPKPVFDKNELKLWWGGENNTGVNADGKIVFNVSHMTKGGSFHDSLSVDAQEKVKNGGLKMFLSLTRDTQMHPFEVDIDANGNAIIDPNSEVGKLFFSVDDKGHAVFQGRFAEVSETFGTDADGRLHVRELATYEGPDHGPITVPGPKEIPINTLEIPIDTEPPYFIPLVPRTPLEPLGYKKPKAAEIVPVNNKIEYYLNYAGGATPAEKLALFEKLRSKTLKENPNAKLDHFEEIALYLEKQDKEYRERIEKLAQSTEKMGKDCKISICIPVAGHQEGNNIYESLKNYTYQTAKPEDFEIVLYVNHPENDKDGNPLNADETMAAIEKFKTDYPDMNVRVMYEALPNDEAKIGRIRKILSDATLVRQHERGKDAPDLIMVSNDADNKGIDPRYIQTFIDKFEENPEVDALLGQLDWDPESYQKYPGVHIGTRLFQYLSVIGRHRTNSMVSSGANSAYRSSMFAGIGGYIDNLQGGEDISIGQAIISARGDNKKALGFAGTTTRLFTSSRRAIDAFKSGLAPVEQWDKGFSAFDDEIRKLTMEDGDAIDYDDLETQEKLKKTFEYIINRTLDSWEAGEKIGKDSPYYRKAIGWLGIKYKLDSKGDMVITKMRPLLDGLKRYQVEGKLMRDARSGKPEAIEELRKIRQQPASNLPQQLNNFSDEVIVGYDTKPRVKNVNEVINSENKESVGAYIISKDFVLSNTETGKVSLGYKPGQDKLLVIKEIDTDYFNGLKESHYWGDNTPESFLKKKGYKNRNVLLPMDTFEVNGKTYRVYEAGDMDLQTYLNNRRLSLDDSIATTMKTSQAVDSLNDAGVINVDISPSNIILSRNNLKITDLDGAAIVQGSQKTSMRDYARGNRFTMAPELFEAKKSFDKTVDVYAASANLYRFITNKWPHDIEKETKDMKASERMEEYKKIHLSGKMRFPGTVPSPIKEVIKKGMSPEPKDRYQSMKEFMSALLHAHDEVKKKQTKVTLEELRENTALTKELVDRVMSDPRLMKSYRKGVERYFNFKGYFTLKTGDPEKAYIDEKYREYTEIPENKDKDIKAFLLDSIVVMEAEFAKQIRGIKEKDNK